MFKLYYRLTKPGIIYGNIITCTAGFLLASRGNINIFLIIETIIGLSLVIGSACVFNNYMDREIDKKMERTKKRALVTNLIPVKNALIFGGVLGIVGSLILLYFTNLNTFLIGLFGFLVYLFAYGYYKRRSPISTLVGAFSGATPPVAGYLAVTNKFDLTAALLFIILICWQMPHFYSIAIYRLKDYASAKLPVLPITNGIFVTKIHMILFIIAFAASCSILTFTGITGFIYLLIILLVSFMWLLYGLTGFKTKDDTKWTRKMFLLSLIVNLSLCILLAFGWIL